MADLKPQAKRRRWRRRLLLVALSIGIVVVALLTGAPQAWLVSYAASRMLDTRVEAEGVSLVHRVYADRIRIYDDDAGQPTVSLNNIGADIDLSAERVVQHLRIGTVLATVRASGDAYSNIEFVRALLDRPRADDGTGRYMPRKITLDSCVIDAELAEMGLKLDSVFVEATLGADGRFAVEVKGNDVRGSHWFGTPELAEDVENGSVDVFATRDVSGLSMMADIALPTFIDVKANASMEVQARAAVWDIDVKSADLAGMALGGLEGIVIPVPVQFAHVKAGPNRVRIRQGNRLTMPSATLDVAARDLYVGPAAGPWYGGDLAIRGTASLDRDIDASVAITFDAGQTATVVAGGSRESGIADVVIANWSRDDLIATVPPRYREQAGALPAFSGFSGNLSVSWKSSAYNATMDFTTSGDSDSLVLGAEGRGHMNGTEPLFAGDVSLGIGTGTLHGDVTLASVRAIQTNLTLSGVKLNRWLHVALGERAPAMPDAIAGGSVAVSSEDMSEQVVADARIELQSLSLGDRALTDDAPLSINGPITWNRASAELTAPALVAELPDRASVTIEGWHHDMASQSGTAKATAHLELDWLAIGELWGNVDVHGPIAYTRDRARGPVTFSTETLGWGDFAVPYGQEITGAADVQFVVNERALALSSVEVGLDAANTIAIEEGSIALNPIAGELPFILATDLQPVVSMGLLESAQGIGTFTGAVTVDESGPGVRGEIVLEAPSVVLPSQRASLNNVHLQSTFAYADTLEGGGSMTADAVTVSGATITDVTTPLAWQGRALLLPEIHGTAYGGIARGEVQIGVLEAGRPLEATLAFEDLDLEAFSKALAPEDFAMTGHAHGNASVRIRESTLAGVDLHAESTKNFSLSRDMVKKILESPRYAGMLGKQLDKALNTILGKESQRPFDSAQVSLALSGENALQGQAVLRSERSDEYRGLDLTVDLTVPVAGLAELMALASDDG